MKNAASREPFDAQQFAASRDLASRVLIGDLTVRHHLDEFRDSHVGGWNSLFNKQQLYVENFAVAERKGLRP